MSEIKRAKVTIVAEDVNKFMEAVKSKGATESDAHGAIGYLATRFFSSFDQATIVLDEKEGHVEATYNLQHGRNYLIHAQLDEEGYSFHS